MTMSTIFGGVGGFIGLVGVLPEYSLWEFIWVHNDVKTIPGLAGAILNDTLGIYMGAQCRPTPDDHNRC